MKKILVVLIILFTTLGSIYTSEIDLGPLGDDLTILFRSIGRDISPIIRQNSISSDTFGEAEIDKLFLPFYLSIPSFSATTGDGIATALTTNDTWNFTIMKLPTLIDSALDEDTKEYYDLTQRVIALPVTKIGFGFALPQGFEFHFNGIYLPEIDYSMFSDTLGNLTLDIMDLGFKVKKVIFSDRGFRPAFSMALGYNYSTFGLGFGINTLTDFLDNLPDVGGLGNLDLKGDLKINTEVTTLSMDLHISKRAFLFTPFFKLSPNIYFTTYKNSASFDAFLYPAEGGGDPVQTTLKIDPTTITSTGFSLMGTAGFELKLYLIALHISSTVDLQNPVITLGDAFSGEFDETSLDKFSINLGFRIQL